MIEYCDHSAIFGSYLEPAEDSWLNKIRFPTGSGRVPLIDPLEPSCATSGSAGPHLWDLCHLQPHQTLMIYRNCAVFNGCMQVILIA